MAKNMYYAPWDCRVRSKYYLATISCLFLLAVRIDCAIQSYCQSTFHPELCVTSLAALPQEETSTPIDVVKSTISIAHNGVLYAIKLFKILSKLPQSAKTFAALEDCLETLEDAADLLNDVSSEISRSNSSELGRDAFDDMLTWTSGAMTSVETCLDGLRGLKNGVGNEVSLDVEHGSKLLSNGLALTRWWKDLAPRPRPRPRSRHLLANEDGGVGKIPAWVLPGHRKLLQASTRELIPNVTVAIDGSGNYTKIQAAVDQAPLKSKSIYIIKIKAGIYKEQVIVPKKAINLAFIGEGIGNTTITASKNIHQNVTTFNTATVIINGGNFLGRDLTIRNTAGPARHQAVALRVSADKVTFYRSSFLGYQDTLYVHSLRQFYKECSVVGTVDFIFGNAAAVLQDCSIMARVGNPNQTVTFTAQGRSDKNMNTGLIFQNCHVTGSRSLKKTIDEHPCYLGRPWKLYARTVFMQSFLDYIIQPSGWVPWSGALALNTSFNGEYDNVGPGAFNDARVLWSTNMTMKQATPFTVQRFIQGNSWIPIQVPFKSGL